MAEKPSLASRGVDVHIQEDEGDPLGVKEVEELHELAHRAPKRESFGTTTAEKLARTVP
jgi:hypothetical protein